MTTPDDSMNDQLNSDLEKELLRIFEKDTLPTWGSLEQKRRPATDRVYSVQDSHSPVSKEPFDGVVRMGSLMAVEVSEGKYILPADAPDYNPFK